MRDEFLPFCRPSIGDEEISAVVDVLRSGWITTGPRVAEFEAAFRDRVGATGAVALGSATAGMHLILHALGIGPGDEVITPSLTWVSTVNLIELAGATPVFADVDRDTLMVTADRVEPLITDRTRLIIPVHFAGAPVDLDPLRDLATERGIPLVEDAAHAVGTEYRGEPVGRRGTSIFSFHPIKNITTGEGGMICSEDEALLERVRRLRFHGLGVDAFDRTIQGRAPQAEVLEPGFKYNLTDIAAALGRVQLSRLDELNAARESICALYRDRLRAVEGLLPLADPAYPCRHARHLFIVRVLPEIAGIGRDRLIRELQLRKIGTGLHFRAVHSQMYYRERSSAQRGTLVDTEWNSERILSLPLFADMTDRDVDDVVDAIRDVLRGRPGKP